MKTYALNSKRAMNTSRLARLKRHYAAKAKAWMLRIQSRRNRKAYNKALTRLARKRK